MEGCSDRCPLAGVGNGARFWAEEHCGERPHCGCLTDTHLKASYEVSNQLTDESRLGRFLESTRPQERRGLVLERREHGSGWKY